MQDCKKLILTCVSICNTEKNNNCTRATDISKDR